MSFINLRVCLENYNNQIETNKENKLSPHHLEFDEKTGWSVVEGKFSGSVQAKKKLQDNVYKELKNIEESDPLLEVFSRMDKSIRNSFPELKPLAEKESIHTLLQREPNETKNGLKIDYKSDPLEFLKQYDGLLNQDLLSEIINTVNLDKYRSENLARSLWMGKDIEDEPTRHLFLQKLASEAPHIVQYYNESNGYELTTEHQSAIAKECKKHIS